MAWISVHEGVDGPKLRALYKQLGCSKFEAVGILNFLWFWGLSNATKEGLILYADKEDVVEVLSGSGAGSKLDFRKVVDALLDTGWIEYTNGGLYIHDWETWQEQWYKAKERRESDAKRKRESRKRLPVPSADNDEDSPHDSPSDIPQDTAGDEKKGDGDDGGGDGPPEEEPKYTPKFEEFWQIYPRKIGKGDAYKKYKARRNDGFSDEQLITAAKVYAAQCKKQKTEKQYIKHPKTFLSDTMPFMDFLPRKALNTENGDDSQQSGNPFKNWEGGQQ